MELSLDVAYRTGLSVALGFLAGSEESPQVVLVMLDTTAVTSKLVLLVSGRPCPPLPS